MYTIEAITVTEVDPSWYQVYVGEVHAQATWPDRNEASGCSRSMTAGTRALAAQ